MSKNKEWGLRAERADQQLRLCQKLSRLMARGLPLGESLTTVVNLVAESMQPDSCLLYLLARGELVLCAASGQAPRAVGNVKLRLDEGLTGWVARERRVLAISGEAYHDPRFKFFRDLPEDTYEAFLSTPIIARNRVVGVINVQHRQSHAHSGDEIEMISTVGELVGGLVAAACLDSATFESAEFADLALAGRAVLQS